MFSSFRFFASRHFILVVAVLMMACKIEQDQSFAERIGPVSKNSGFRMDGYYVWGGSVIKVDGMYHMFASRWPSVSQFPADYFHSSEIVHAISKSPEGPYNFQKVVIGERDSVYWDSNMAHNPSIYKIDGHYVLFYNASDFSTMRTENRPLRRVGYAVADNINGPWKRQDQPVLNVEANNPALMIEQDRSIKLMYRDASLRIYIASAPSLKGPYSVVNDNVWSEAKLEDFYLFKKDGNYHLICEDNVGALTGHERWGAHLISPNGIDRWEKHDPVIVYDHTIEYKDGSLLNCTRRERPQLLIENNEITYLFNGIYDGTHSWCQPVPLAPPIPVKNH